MNLSALNGKLELKGKLKFKRKYNNKPLPFFPFYFLNVRNSKLSVLVTVCSLGPK